MDPLMLEDLDDPALAKKVKDACSILRRTLALYPHEKVAFSFNGGKDSTVLLHLLRATMASDASSLSSQGGRSFRSFYFVWEDDFEEVDKFVREIDVSYNLQVDYLNHPDFKQGLADFISSTGVSAIILGTRRGDPNARDQEFFCPSSEGWPPFMRVNPILDWTYSDVWAFLKTFKLPYCQLYDQGYTSLGCRQSTLPNSALQLEDGSFAPAYLLSDGRLERAGRVSGSMKQGPAVSGSFSHTAAVVVVGDELLSGKVEDSNISYLCSELHAIGWQVTRVVLLPDDLDSIASEIRLLSQTVEVVFTTGGMGPTLDDVTMSAVARALNKKLVRHPGLEKRIRSFFGDDVGPAHMKMADLPEGESELLDYHMDNGQVSLHGEVSKWPVVRCRNIYVLPGVPHLMRQKWMAIKGVLTGDARVKPFRNQTFRLGIQDETKIAGTLEEISRIFGVNVHIGSYPVSNQEDGAQILVTLDSKLHEHIEDAAKQMRLLLPAGSIIREDQDVRALLRRKDSDMLSP